MSIRSRMPHRYVESATDLNQTPDSAAHRSVARQLLCWTVVCTAFFVLVRVSILFWINSLFFFRLPIFKSTAGRLRSCLRWILFLFWFYLLYLWSWKGFEAFLVCEISQKSLTLKEPCEFFRFFPKKIYFRCDATKYWSFCVSQSFYEIYVKFVLLNISTIFTL